MLIQRVEIKNFLNHRDNGAGVGGLVEIDFRSSALWLIHGPNGAGKSAIFDAITFALFGKHRGSGSKEGKLYRLINDDADQAEINLEIELNDHRYLVQRKITRKGRKGNNGKREGAEAWGIVRQWIGDDWKAVPNTEKRVEEWVQEQLRMSYDTFVSAVLLRQGEADTFLKAKPADRKTRLLELLDLEFYERLGEAANHRQTEWRKERDRYQKEIERMTAVTQADIDEKKANIKALEKTFARAQKDLAKKDAKLIDARRAATLTSTIRGKERQRHDDAEIMAKADQILSNALRYRELQLALPLFNNLWDARQRVSEEESQIKGLQETLATLRVDQTRSVAQLDDARVREERAGLAFSVANGKRDQAAKEQLRRSEHLRQLQQIETLDRQIEETRCRVQPSLAILKEASEIERLAGRYEVLRNVVPLLQALNDADVELVEAKANITRTESSLTEREQAATTAAAEETKWRETGDAAATRYEETQVTLNQLRQKLSILCERLNARNSITGQEECPVCGSSLDNAEVRSRLEHERSHWRKEVLAFESEEKSFIAELAIQKKNKSHALARLTEASQSSRRADSEVAVGRGDRNAAHSAVIRAEKLVVLAKERSGEWDGKADQLLSLKAEFEQLTGAPERVPDLQRAQQEEAAAVAVIKTYQGQLAGFPNWSFSERETVRLHAAESEKAVDECQSEVTTCEAEAKESKVIFAEIEGRHRNLENTINVDVSRLTDSQSRKQQADRELLRRQEALPPTWKDHSASADKTVLDNLQNEFERLSQAEAEERQLRAAQTRSDEIAGAIRALTLELDGIDAEHRCPVPKAEAECTAAKNSRQEAERALANCNLELAALSQQKNTYDERQHDRDKAEQELGYYLKLVAAFGRNGLQAAVVKTAQEAVTRNANATLGRLSRGLWQVELEENEQKTELEILARDLSQPSAPLRPFAYLSGGEKFRVAISLAVAVGQSVTGGRTVDTLIIDEGFGALDEVNRGLLISELSRLSEEVLQGGRVIVVSHEDDVCEEFANRYHVFEDSNGDVQLQPSLL
jgi:exonuclease SbcC